MGGASGSTSEFPGASGGAAGAFDDLPEPVPQPEPEVDEAGCPEALLGWGAVAGDGVQVTTGGGDATAVRPTSVSELMGYASDSMPRVIEIEGSFDVSRLDVTSNKTLVGIGPDATIRGGLVIRGSLQAPVSNVIVRNLNIDGGATGGEDAVQVQFAHHLWFDHCDIWDGPDGNLDMTHAVNWSTISWTIFRYTSAYRRPAGESGDHRFSNLIGHDDDNAGEDRGRLKITLHHNWWGEGVIERMPRVRFGEVHVFNNYYSSGSSNYCVGAGAEAHLLVENNYFDGVSSPHRYINAADANTANVSANGNEYPGASGERVTGGGGQAFTTPGYSVELDAAADVKELVQRCAGPR
jgi:pectate lyase